MLIYEKKVLETPDGGTPTLVKHLFGTMKDIPSDDDVQLTYKDDEGNEITDIKNLTFFYDASAHLMKANDSKRQLPDVDDTKVNVLLGNEVIIGTACRLTANEVENGVVSFNVATDKVTNVLVGTTVTLNVSAAIEDYIVNTCTATANGEDVGEFTIEDGVASVEYTVQEDTDFIITAEITQAK